MKKVLFIFITIFITIFSINITNANKTTINNVEHKLYRAVVMSTIQIKKDYWEKINQKIVSVFIKFRYSKDITTLNKLEILLKDKIIKLNQKNILTYNEKNKLNLYTNLYYRTILVLKYNLN
jgi:hypothetical protein